MQVVVALQAVGGVEIERALHEVVVNDPDAEVRRVTVRTLQKLGSPGAWWAVNDATVERNVAVR